MSKLVVCSSCLGFLNSGAAACPHCDAPQVIRSSTGTIVKTVIAAVAGLGFMSTMMACYGGPPQTDAGPGNDTGVTTDSGTPTDAAVTDSGTVEDASIDGGG
jgi:hypothetical protein